MRRDSRSLLWDVREAALAIQTFTQGMDLIAYEHNSLVQAGVERKFEVIGEALNQLSKLDPGLPARLTYLRMRKRSTTRQPAGSSGPKLPRSGTLSRPTTITSRPLSVRRQRKKPL